MKKLFICAMCAFLCGCTNESYFEVEQEISANSIVFDKNAEFFSVCVDIINVHKDFDEFREVLPKNLLEKMDRNSYSESEAVEIIFWWFSNDRCADILVEWPEFDTFLELLPEDYHFCI